MLIEERLRGEVTTIDEMDTGERRRRYFASAGCEFRDWQAVSGLGLGTSKHSHRFWSRRYSAAASSGRLETLPMLEMDGVVDG